MRESKECLECGGIYFRPESYTLAMWEARRYCGASCAGKAGARRLHRKEEPEAILPGALMPVDPVAAQTVREPPASEREPVMRDLRIVRVGPNPKLLVCEYYELATRRVCTVLVKKTDKFVRGMRFKMAEPVAQADFIRPWVYQGPAPRHRGRW